MSVHADTFWNQLDISRRNDPLSVRPTHWGIIVADRTSVKGNGAIAEAILKVLAVILMFSSIIPWISIGSEFATGSLTLKIAHTVSFFSVGLAVYWHAGRGFLQEFHADSIRQELRLATRNSRNISFARQRIPMAAVESCFLKRSKASMASTKMLLRLKGRQMPLTIASGNERDLLPVLEQVVELIKTTRRVGNS
ncbi:MAG: hypothetical protein ACR2O1_08990 [Boseongicola sp.]